MSKRKFYIFYALIAVCAITGVIMKENQTYFFTCVFLVVILIMLAAISFRQKSTSSKNQSSN